MDRPIDLRSDTVTLPTAEMMRAMATAELGDDVYGEDPTVRRLEEIAAARVGKEAALFVPTGTMGNAVAALTHTRRGQEVIVGADTHVYEAEVGGLAVISGLLARPLPCRQGHLDPGEVEAVIRPEDVHYARTGLLCLEDPHNAAGGMVTPPAMVAELAAVAHGHGVPVHLDGARLFNAAVALGVEAAELTEAVDSVMFCVSKGLGAPVGSLLAGREEFIAEARRNRKLLGGGMRQVGVLAAAGIVALETMVERLAEDHRNARVLAEGLAGLPGLVVDRDSVQTNMVYADTAPGAAEEFVAGLRAAGVLINAVGPSRVRFVTHKDVDRAGIDRALTVAREVAGAAPKVADALHVDHGRSGA